MKRNTCRLALFILLASLSSVEIYAAKPPCVQNLGACPNQGCGGDPALNRGKNRTDLPTQLEEWSVVDVVDLDEDTPKTWFSNRQELKEFAEGTAVVVTGYLINAHVTKTPESTNCYLKGKDNNDFISIWLKRQMTTWPSLLYWKSRHAFGRLVGRSRN